MRKGLHRRDHHHICRSPFLETKAEDNRTGRFFPFRAIRWFYVIYTPITSILISTQVRHDCPLSSVHMAMMKLTAKFLISCVLSGVCFSFSDQFVIRVILARVFAIHCIINTAGLAVLLTILTYFSTPILTSIFGDGTLEVKGQTYKDKKKILLYFLLQG